MTSTSCSPARATSALTGSTIVSTLLVSSSASSCSYGLSMSTTTSADLLSPVVLRRCVRHVREHLRLVRKVRRTVAGRPPGRVGALRERSALGAHAHGLAGALLALDDRDLHVVVLLAVRRLVDLDGRAGRHGLREHLIGQRVLDIALDGPAQRARAHRG